MIDTLKYLTQIDPPRNHKNISSLNAAAAYLEGRFQAIGLETSFQIYTVDDHEYKNVIATLNPQHQSRLVIGGHYDVCGNIQGADDNPSAVAGVIESAKRLYAIKELIPFRIDFVCFTLEEPPYFGTEYMGSYQYAKSLHVNNVDLIGMINYEMIGYYTDENIDISLFEPFIVKKDADISKGDFIAIVSDEQSQSFMSSFDFMNVTKKIQHLEAVLSSPMSFVTASDHLNF